MARNEWDDLCKIRMYSTHREVEPSVTSPASSPKASESKAQWPSRCPSSTVTLHSTWPRLLQWSLLLYKPRKSCSGICGPFLLPCKSHNLKSHLTGGSGPPSEWHILRGEGFFFYNSKILRCGESQWNKKISYMLWSIIKCMGSRWFYLLTNYLLCFLLIQLSLKNKKF